MCQSVGFSKLAVCLELTAREMSNVEEVGLLYVGDGIGKDKNREWKSLTPNDELDERLLSKKVVKSSE